MGAEAQTREVVQREAAQTAEHARTAAAEVAETAKEQARQITGRRVSRLGVWWMMPVSG